MRWGFLFFFNSIMLGAGLAMDAFSVSLANGMHEKRMRCGRMCMIAGTYAFFQFMMPMIGWMCVRTIAETFGVFEKLIPWIALILLLYIGGRMIFETLRGGKEESAEQRLGFGSLMLQGIATSIDALSVGFTIADYGITMAVVCGLIIAAVTFVLCMAGLAIGKRFGVKLADRAGILGGVILIVIGLEIFLKGVVF